MTSPSVIVWFRQDLRLADNPAVQAALVHKLPIIPVFIEDTETKAPYSNGGGATRWWLHHSLAQLAKDLEACGSRLILKRGSPRKVLVDLAAEAGAQFLHWNRCYEPHVISRDTEVKQSLVKQGLQVSSHNGSLLCEPWEIQTKTGGPYQVFTPFSRAVREHPVPAPLPAPRKLPAPEEWPSTLKLEEFRLLPRIKWDAGFCEAWTPGTTGAQRELKRFTKSAVRDYKADRDRPDHHGTSRLSSCLHFGELSPRQIWHEACAALGEDPERPQVAEPYLRQLIWRDFGHHLLYHFPQTVTTPLREDFTRFPWKNNSAYLRAWQRGLTGFPIVDAGMRELRHTGWMHNRVRMIAASFLVKDLLIPWQAGADWFWDTLVDADLANNTLGWQWVAGCGADAAPYFRIFNPVTQGTKFDPEGAYVRHWIPELQQLPEKFIHAPWEAPVETLKLAGIKLGSTYPRPLVDHNEARKSALEALQSMKNKSAE